MVPGFRQWQWLDHEHSGALQSWSDPPHAHGCAVSTFDLRGLSLTAMVNNDLADYRGLMAPLPQAVPASPLVELTPTDHGYAILDVHPGLPTGVERAAAVDPKYRKPFGNPFRIDCFRCAFLEFIRHNSGPAVLVLETEYGEGLLAFALAADMAQGLGLAVPIRPVITQPSDNNALCRMFEGQVLNQFPSDPYPLQCDPQWLISALLRLGGTAISSTDVHDRSSVVQLLRRTHFVDDESVVFYHHRIHGETPL